MKKGLLIVLILFPLFYSCQTMVEKKEIKDTKVAKEDKVLKEVMRKIRQWEGYIRLIDHKDFSLYTLMRLTEGYFEAKEILFKREMDKYEKKIELYNKGLIEEEPPHPVQDYTSLVENFRKLASRYRYGRMADAIRYALGYALYEEGRLDEAVEVFEELIENYPKSTYFVEVCFRLGEFYFETGQLKEAMDSYIMVMDFPHSVFYEKAMYKLAWVYYKLDEFEKAVDLYMRVMDRMPEEERQRRSALRDEALSGIVMSLAHFKSMEEAVEYIESKGLRRYTPVVLKKLGDRLVEETRYREALVVYSAMERLFPGIAYLPFLYEQIAQLHERLDDSESALKKRWQIVVGFNPTTKWYRDRYPEGYREVDELIARVTVSASKEFHIRGRKNDDYDDLRRAVKGYRVFLASFPEYPQVKEVNLLLAEALFDMRRFDEAVAEYEKTISLYPDGPERTEIAYSIFLTYEAMFHEYTLDREETVQSAERIVNTYMEGFRKENRLERVLLRLSDMYIGIDKYDKAREVLKPLIEDKPVETYKRIAELYLAEGDVVEAEKTYRRLVDISDDPSFRQRLAELNYMIGEDSLKRGGFVDATERFIEVHKILPDSQLAEASLVRAGQIYIQTGDFTGFDRLIDLLKRSYPGSTSVVSLLVSAGKELEDKAPLESARYYTSASTLVTDGTKSSSLLLAAGILYENNQEYSMAEEIFKRYLSRGDISIKDRGEVLSRLGEIQLKMGKKKEGLETFGQLFELKGMVDDRYVVKAGLHLIKERQVEYLDTRLVQPFEETLRTKTELLNVLLNEYTELAEYGVAEFMPEIFFQIGRLLENYRDSIIQSERPSDLSEEELEEYNFLLEERAYPYEEKAVKAYENVLRVAREYRLYDEWVEKTVQRLAYLRPALYKRDFAMVDVEPFFIYPEPVTLEYR